MDYLEEKQLQYIVAAKFTKPIQYLIDGTQVWIKIDADIEICNQTYQAGSWENPRRLIIVRRKITNKDKTIGKTLSLFPEDEIHKNYKYSAYFTNQITGSVDVCRCYRARGDAENRIKELKQDFGMDSFVLKDFFASQAALLFVMFAYNLVSIFRIVVLQEKTQKTLSTLRYRTFAIGAYIEKINGKLTLKIALNKKRRSWFDGLWNYAKIFEFPFVISNA
jgi:hypothetical protein